MSESELEKLHMLPLIQQKPCGGTTLTLSSIWGGGGVFSSF